MKYVSTIAVSAALCLAFCASCGEGKVDASSVVDQAKGAVENLDIENLSTDALKEAAGGMVEKVTSQLGDIKDLASAEKAKEALGPILDQFTSIEDKLGAANLPDLGSISEAVESLKSKFSGDAGIMDMLKPVLDKITALMG